MAGAARAPAARRASISTSASVEITYTTKQTVSSGPSDQTINDMSKTVLGIILGGGAGSRLYPLTKKRAKPAVPLGANYRLIDIPVSNCINSGVNKIYCLTQFNSASLNRHLSQAYNAGVGGYTNRGFVEVLAASQTTSSKEWFQGTADAVRQYLWLFEEACRDGIEDFLILSGDHLYRMDYSQFVLAHRQAGADITDETVHRHRRAVTPDTTATLIYTSGTTGPPKGVMISHRNAVWTAQLLVDLLGDLSHLDRLVSYLPLSHIAAQLLDVYCAATIGATVHFARPDALKGSLVETLRAVQPTLFFGVPRVWEKMREGLRRAAAQIGRLKRQLGGWAKQKGAERCQLAQFGAGGGAPGGYGCAHNMVLGPLKRKLGLEQARACFTGAAPIDREVLEYFGSLDIPVYELYGQSECTGPHTLNYPGRWRLGSCGRTLLGAETRIDPETQEILIRGPHVCLGYRGQASPLREGGWLPTGDMGRLDDDGFLYITGRLKELLITAGGENVPPTLIEAALTRAMPWLSSCVVVGDRQKFLAVLLAVPHDKETGVLGEEVRAALDLEDDCTVTAEAFTERVDAGLATANAEAASAAQTVKKWALLPQELSLENGELTPTLKIRRPQVLERHAELLRSLYPADGEAAATAAAKD